SDGEKGLNRANLLKPDLILMDIVMPGLNGFKATRQLAKTAATQHIPVLVISGKAQESDRQWALRQGACDYLVKPIQETSLLDKVNALLAAESASSADGSASNA
ncbi:MAG: response regulator, partial [Candidatus Competibacteraceae bacterium]|nr:response regulator [Candidatus Competibacteraceae bacterium]